MVWSLDWGTLGVLLCFDSYFADAWAQLAALNTDVVVLPTSVNSRGVDSIPRGFGSAHLIYIVSAGEVFCVSLAVTSSSL